MRLGTRGSKLALVQAESVKTAFQRLDPFLEIDIQVITTTGDLRSGHKTLDKKEWVEQLEDALVSGHIDYAVHSAKDVPAVLHLETEVCSVLKRQNPLDVVISGGKESSLVDFVDGAVIGTSSLRRKTQIGLIRPDLKVVSLRGNVPTRIDKCLSKKECDAMVIAAAGLERLSLQADVSFELSPEQMLPAACQGTLALQYRLGECPPKGLIDLATERSFTYERAVVRALDADCSSALGVFYQDGLLRVRLCGNGCLDYSGACGDQDGLERFINQLLAKDAKKVLRNNLI